VKKRNGRNKKERRRRDVSDKIEKQRRYPFAKAPKRTEHAQPQAGK